jgi:hypothetical protein
MDGRVDGWIDEEEAPQNHFIDPGCDSRLTGF